MPKNIIIRVHFKTFLSDGHKLFALLAFFFCTFLLTKYLKDNKQFGDKFIFRLACVWCIIALNHHNACYFVMMQAKDAQVLSELATLGVFLRLIRVLNVELLFLFRLNLNNRVSHNLLSKKCSEQSKDCT